MGSMQPLARPAPGGLSSSHVLMAMGLTPPEALSSIRFGFSRYNTEAEIDYVISVLAMIAKNLKTGVSLSSTASA